MGKMLIMHTLISSISGLELAFKITIECAQDPRPLPLWDTILIIPKHLNYSTAFLTLNRVLSGLEMFYLCDSPSPD